VFVPGSLSEFRRTSDDLDATENRRAAASQSPEQKQKGPIRVQTDLVNILANVLNANNEPVVGLDQSAFDLTEDGVPQKIVRFEPQTNRPLDLALMVDMSGSAAIELKIEKDAAEHFFAEVVRPGDKLAVFSFTSDVNQLSNYTDNIKLLDDSIRKAEPGADMGTSLYDALVLSSATLKRQASDRRRAIVLITDAGETTSYYKFEDATSGDLVRRAAVYNCCAPDEVGRRQEHCRGARHSDDYRRHGWRHVFPDYGG
jgi:Ca-activated chloride channel family protein